MKVGQLKATAVLTENQKHYAIHDHPGLYKPCHPSIGEVIASPGRGKSDSWFRRDRATEDALAAAMGWIIQDPDLLMICDQCGEPASSLVDMSGTLVCSTCLPRSDD